MAIFPTFFFLGNIGQEIVFYDILKRKNAFLGYKNKKSKNWHFSKGVNPFAPGDFAEKSVLKLVEWSLSCYKELQLTTNRFTDRALRGLLFQIQNISLGSTGMRRKQSDTAVLTFTFRFLPSLLFSLFLPHFFFLLLGI